MSFQNSLKLSLLLLFVGALGNAGVMAQSRPEPPALPGMGYRPTGDG